MASYGDRGGVDWDVILRRLDVLRHHCGDLCDTSKALNKVSCYIQLHTYVHKHVSFHKGPGEFMGSITANVSDRSRELWEFKMLFSD